MRASEFMTTPVVTVAPDSSITNVGRLLLERNVTAVPVVDGDGLLVGMVSRSDLIRGRVVPDPRAHLRPVPADDSEPPHRIRDVMTQSVIALAPTDDDAEFTRMMLEHRVKSIPVVSDGHVVGLVSATDILRTKVRDDAAIARDVQLWLRQLSSEGGPWAIAVDDGVVTISGSPEDPHRHVACLLAETVPGVVRARYCVNPALSPPVAETVPAVPPQEGPTDHRGMTVLRHQDCVERLRASNVGRLGFIQDGTIVIVPVNHGMDGMNIVFRTTWGSKQQAAERSDAVAFEVDSFDEGSRGGWSVMVKGTASPVYDDEDVARYDRLDIPAWVGSNDDAMWIRIRPDEISGRQIVPRAPAAAVPAFQSTRVDA